MLKLVLFETIQFSISTQFECQKQFYFQQFSLAYVRRLNIKIVLYQAIQFSISTQLGSILYIHRIYQLLPLWASVDLGAMAMKGVLCIPQNSIITRTSPSDCLVPYLGHPLQGFYLLFISLRNKTHGLFISGVQYV